MESNGRNELPITKETNFFGPAGRAVRPPDLRCNRDNPQRTTGPADNFQWSGNHDRTSWGKLIEVRQARQTKLSAAMHQEVVGKGRVKSGRLAGIGTDRLNPDSQHISLLRQESRGLFRESGSVRPVLLYVDVILGILSLGPVRAQQNPCRRRDVAVLLLPLTNPLWRKKKVWILCSIRTNVNDARGADKFLCRNAINGIVRQIFSRDPVDRSIKMCARVLSSLESIPVPRRSAVVIARQFPNLKCRSVVPLRGQR